MVTEQCLEVEISCAYRPLRRTTSFAAKLLGRCLRPFDGRPYPKAVTKRAIRFQLVATSRLVKGATLKRRRLT